MAMTARILIIFVCEFVCGFGAIVLSPAHPPLPAEAADAAGLQWKGRTLANKLQQVWNPQNAAGPIPEVMCE